MLKESLSSDSSDDEYDEEEVSLEEGQSFLCLFCGTSLLHSSSLFDHIISSHNVDIVAIFSNLSFHDVIKVINYTRSTHCTEKEFLKIVASTETMSDEFLKPAIDDDALLMIDFEELTHDLPSNGFQKSPQNGSTHNEVQSDSKIKLLENKLAQLQSVYLDLLESKESRMEPRAPSSDKYFDSYAHYSIHSEMLQDTIRTEAYRDYIYNNSELFIGKAVLDVGCGTGILSLFCARAGAGSIVAVDNSRIVDKARSIIRKNNFNNKIRVVEGKVEEVQFDQKFDVLISEWMGYALLFECMLDSVIIARDKYLKPGGLVVPNRASMFVAGISDSEKYQKRFGLWRNVYGFDMSDIVPDLFKEAVVQEVESKHVISTACGFKHLDLSVVQVPDLEFSSPFQLQITKSDILTGLVVYFTCFFDGNFQIVLDTSPMLPSTHWTQTALYFKTPVNVSIDDIVEGVVSFKKNVAITRGYLISIECKICNGKREVATQINQQYLLN